jgi:hypothetical protein
MVAMPRAGGGDHYRGDTTEELMEPFQKELALPGPLALRKTSAPDGVGVESLNPLRLLPPGTFEALSGGCGNCRRPR